MTHQANATARRLPSWIRVRLRSQGHFPKVAEILRDKGLRTVCDGADCPNKPECYGRGTATVMILGDVCTRSCRFCAVPFGQPRPVALDEPARVAAFAQALSLTHVVVTSVTRDDLPDGGARVFAATIIQLKRLRSVTVEVLTPDFQGHEPAVAIVLSAAPQVFNHNLETVRRLQPQVRPQADYDRSLKVLRFAAAWAPELIVKSGLMVGLGETDDELMEALTDLRTVGCRSLTLGQYLAPSRQHLPVARYVRPEQFAHYQKRAFELGFAAVAAGALVRSSYRAEQLMAKHG